MERWQLKKLKELFGENYLGPELLKEILPQSGLAPLNDSIPSIDMSVIDGIDPKEYLLVLGWPLFHDGTPLSIIKLRGYFGVNCDECEPCFYNQDWYLQESFANNCTIEYRWYLVKKNVYENSRSVQPESYKLPGTELFPTALLCAYTFFVYYLSKNKPLWANDFIWCNDKDQNGDIIYIGRYLDPIGVSKKGFSIHRHLRIRNSYGIIGCI
jgi:hypothetical protein